MIVNEIAKLENPLQPRVQLLLVAELGELLLVGDSGSAIVAIRPLLVKGLMVRP